MAWCSTLSFGFLLARISISRYHTAADPDISHAFIRVVIGRMLDVCAWERNKRRRNEDPASAEWLL